MQHITTVSTCCQVSPDLFDAKDLLWRFVLLESDMPYMYYVDSGVLFKMTVNQSMVQLVADVTSDATTVSGI